MILAINGRRVFTDAQYHSALNASPDGVATLHIRDRNTGNVQIWVAELDRIAD